MFCHQCTLGIAILSRRFTSIRASGLAVMAQRFASVRASGLAFLLRRFALGSRPASRLWRSVLPSVRARPCSSIAVFCLRSRLSFFPCQEKRSGLRYLTFLFRRVEIAIRAFSQRSSVICLCGFTSGLAVYLWRSRRGCRGRWDGEWGWRRGLCASLRDRIVLVMLSAGSTLGLRAPDCAKESSTLWTLLTLRRGCVGACSPCLCVFAWAHWL